MLCFEWDPDKAKRNVELHDVSFDEASTAFGDTLSLVIYDPLHSQEEDRYVLIGDSHKGRLLVAVYTERGDRIRLISARTASKNERLQYERNARRSGHA